MKVLQALMLSPWKNLVARHILRPLYVHAGVCAKLLSSKAGAAKELRSQNWSNIFALSVRLERIKQLYSEVISQLFSKMLSKPAEEFIKARISRTVDCCGFNSVASEMITFFRADSKAFTAVLKPLVTDQRYHVEHAALRNLFRGIVSAVSPRLSQDLVSVVESNLIFDRIDTAIAMCRSDVGIKQLVSCFSEGKVISTNEVITDPRSRFAVERAVVINTSRLGAVDAMQYAHVLAEGVSNYFASSPKSIGAVEADTLQYILQVRASITLHVCTDLTNVILFILFVDLHQ
ncbi:hypothetical protein EON65_13495 [archaeon]|nr:MAG: hypothetical protein EON65_13495 [archaeon]